MTSKAPQTLPVHGPAGYDDTPPKSQWILFYTVLSVLTLVGLKFAFDSYYDIELRGEQATKLEESPALLLKSYKQEQARVLDDGPRSVDDAIDLMARQGRSAVPAIAPQPSADSSALEGWLLLQDEEDS